MQQSIFTMNDLPNEITTKILGHVIDANFTVVEVLSSEVMKLSLRFVSQKWCDIMHYLSPNGIKTEMPCSYERKLKMKVPYDPIDSLAFLGWLNLILWIDEKFGWKRKHRGRTRATTYTMAAWGGHLDVLKWLHKSKKYVWDEGTCAAAASGGHLDVLIWLRKSKQGGKSCPWDSRTYSNASSEGHLDILEWAIQNDCPYSFVSKRRNV